MPALGDPQAQVVPLLWSWTLASTMLMFSGNYVTGSTGLESNSFPPKRVHVYTEEPAAGGVWCGWGQILPPDTSHSGFLADLVRILVVCRKKTV